MCPMVIGMPAQPHIGAAIRRARQRLRMSQDDLALKVGASRSAVNAWERGRARPRNIVALEEVLGVSLDAEPASAATELWRVPEDKWEAAVLADPDMDAAQKRDLIEASRAARAAYAGRHAAEPGRQAG